MSCIAINQRIITIIAMADLGIPSGDHIIYLDMNFILNKFVHIIML